MSTGRFSRNLTFKLKLFGNRLMTSGPKIDYQKYGLLTNDQSFIFLLTDSNYYKVLKFINNMRFFVHSLS